MISGIGVDIVEIARMEDSLSRLGDRFAQRILAEKEFLEFQENKFPARFLAKRFAAKEAAVKALGTGFINGISMHHIYVAHDELGKPIVCFEAAARAILEQKNITASHISIADEKHYAMAYVVLEV